MTAGLSSRQIRHWQDPEIPVLTTRASQQRSTASPVTRPTVGPGLTSSLGGLV